MRTEIKNVDEHTNSCFHFEFVTEVEMPQHYMGDDGGMYY